MENIWRTSETDKIGRLQTEKKYFVSISLLFTGGITTKVLSNENCKKIKTKNLKNEVILDHRSV